MRIGNVFSHICSCFFWTVSVNTCSVTGRFKFLLLIYKENWKLSNSTFASFTMYRCTYVNVVVNSKGFMVFGVGYNYMYGLPTCIGWPIPSVIGVHNVNFYLTWLWMYAAYSLWNLLYTSCTILITCKKVYLHGWCLFSDTRYNVILKDKKWNNFVLVLLVHVNMY